MIFPLVRSQSVCIFFLCETEVARLVFRQSVLLRQRFEFCWNNQNTRTTSRFLLLEILATNLFDSFAFKQLFNRLDNSMETGFLSIKLSHDNLSTSF